MAWWNTSPTGFSKSSVSFPNKANGLGGFPQPRSPADNGPGSEIQAPLSFAIVLVRLDSPKDFGLNAQGKTNAGFTAPQ